MAFCSIPRDLGKIKTKVAFNLSARQLICFGTAVVVGIPAYIFTQGAVGNNGAALLMIGLMLPFFFLGMYERDGLPAEIILRNYIRTHIFWPGIRTYKTENFYEVLSVKGKVLDKKSKSANKILGEKFLNKEGKSIAIKNKAATKTLVAKRTPGKRKPC